MRGCSRAAIGSHGRFWCCTSYATKISSMVSTTQLNSKPSGILLLAYCTDTAFLSDPGCLRSNENLDMTVVRLRKYPKAFLNHILQRDAGRNHALRAFEFTY